MRAYGSIGAFTLLIANSVVQADAITDWNNVALDAIRSTSTNPPRATRALAMTHVAIFDAVNGIAGEYEPYHADHPAPPGASQDAAAASAAFTVLSAIFPQMSATFEGALDTSLSAVESIPARKKGEAYGRFVGRKILELRAEDGSSDVVVYMPSGVFGFWQPTPPAFAPALLPNWPFVTPFAMTSGDQFQPPATPAFDSQTYADAYNEVKDYGDVDSVVRTADQTEIAYFWEDGATTVTPPGHWQIIAQQISEQFELSLLENARLFALLSMVQADGAICAWDAKYVYDHLRPYTGITLEADDDGNPDTEADPTWFNLIPTPPFPAYTSGHSTFSGGSAKVLELFFGTDEIPFCGESPDPDHWPLVLPGVVRCWDTLSEAAEEAGQSRIYGGIHWQYDNQQGLNSGRALAEYVFANFLRPLED